LYLQLFMEGTQLKQLADAYTESEKLLRQMKENITSIENNIPTLKEDAVKWSKELKSMENATAMKQRVLVIKQDLAWAYPVQKKGVSETSTHFNSM
jgi:septal ring factor EnvC (AmiA/AmiB activator)